jgi:hypothetical protein
LKTLLDLRHQHHPQSKDDEDSSKEEADLVERFNVLWVATSICGVILAVENADSYSAQGITKSIFHRGQSCPSLTSDSLPPFQAKTQDHASILESIRLMPYFFISPQIKGSQEVDATKVINELKYLVSLLSPRPTGALSTGDIAVMVLHANRLHAESIFGLHGAVNGGDVKNKLICTWSTLTAARYCFWYGVLGMKKVGLPVATKLLTHLSTILLEDAESDISALVVGQCNPDLWIWKIFSAALAVKRFWRALNKRHGSQRIQQMQSLTKSRIELWRRVEKIDHWFQVENVLRRIVWPETGCEDALTIWEVVRDERLQKVHVSIPITKEVGRADIFW